MTASGSRLAAFRCSQAVLRDASLFSPPFVRGRDRDSVEPVELKRSRLWSAPVLPVLLFTPVGPLPVRDPVEAPSEGRAAFAVLLCTLPCTSLQR